MGLPLFRLLRDSCVGNASLLVEMTVMVLPMPVMRHMLSKSCKGFA